MIGLDKRGYMTEQRESFRERDLKLAKNDNAYIKAKNTEDHFSIGGQGK